ncbi:MAG: hypothetical protein KAI24_16465 [Planctomycetes bacterium]|nr:hypothetical protein [Planctomycetota bacterium]
MKTIRRTRPHAAAALRGALLAALASALAAQDTATIRGRCVRLVDDAPVAACVVTFEVRGLVGASSRGGRVRTGDDGRFELDVPALPGVEVHFATSHPECAPHRSWAGSLRAGVVYEPVLRLARGAVVMGTVRDEHGRAVTHGFDLVSAVRRRPPPGPTAPGAPQPFATSYAERVADAAPLVSTNLYERLGERYRVQVDEDGRFCSPRVPHGAYRVEPREPGWITARPFEVLVESDEPPPIAVVVRAVPTVSGQVLDERGRPVENMLLRIHRSSGGGPTQRTGPDGRFLLPRVAGVAPTPRVMLDGCADCEPRRATPPLRWGDDDVVVEMRRWPTVGLRVTRADDGEPFEDFAVRSWQVGGHHSTSALRLPGGHRGGRARVTAPPGPGWIAVVPRDRRWHVAYVELGDGPRPQWIDVRVHRLVATPLRLVNENGAPLAGVTVQVLVGDRARHGQLFAAAGDVLAFLPREPGVLPERQIARATTDRDGRCVVLAPPGDRPVRLSILGVGRPRSVDGVSAGGPEREIVVE